MRKREREREKKIKRIGIMNRGAQHKTFSFSFQQVKPSLELHSPNASAFMF